MFYADSLAVVSSIRHRLAALKKKMQVIANRSNVANTTPPTKRSPTPTTAPTIASVSPR